MNFSFYNRSPSPPFKDYGLKTPLSFFIIVGTWTVRQEVDEVKVKVINDSGMTRGPF